MSRTCPECGAVFPKCRYAKTCGAAECLSALKSRNARGRAGRGGRAFDIARGITAYAEAERRGWPAQEIPTNGEVERWRDRTQQEPIERAVALARYRWSGWRT